MRKLLFALAVMMTGAFAFAVGTPASAMTAGPVTSLNDAVKSGATDVTYYRRYNYCDDYPWRCRRHHYRRHYYRPYWRPYYRPYRRHYYRPYYRRHYYRPYYYRW